MLEPLGVNMRKKRIPKDGVVYIAVSECGNFGKYGASINLINRLYGINRENPFNAKFSFKAFAYSRDIYDLEKELKWRLWGLHWCVGEYLEFRNPDYTPENLIALFKDLCKKQGALCT